MSSERLRSLDGLRALSVAGVFFSGYHWMLPFGWIGVLVFYVLSGFLITRILLDERALAKQAQGASGFFGRFYFRRTLRIFPLYFAYLLALELTHALAGAPEGWERVRPFALLYGVNVGMITGHVGVNDAWGHLWTLSVEEQFYLVWPVLVWLLPTSAVPRLALALVVSGPLLRWATMSAFDWDIGRLYVSSLSHVDAFAVGAVLASRDTSRLPRALPLLAITGCLTLLAGVAIALANGAALRTLGYPEGLYLGHAHLWGYTALDLCAGLLVLAALRGELPLLGHPVLAYLGKISYGIYLLQRPIKGIYLAQLEPYLLSALPSRTLALALGAVVCASLAVALAALSFHAFEAPILRYRDRVRPPLRAPVREPKTP